MSWYVEAAGRRTKAFDMCAKQKYFIEHAPMGVQTALRELVEYFPPDSVVRIICNGDIQGGGGSVRIEISNIPHWIE